jgi:hypothetical protein
VVESAVTPYEQGQLTARTVVRNFPSKHLQTPAMHIPPELWLEIFEWATYNPLLNVTESHLPFQPAPFRDKNPDTNLNVRLTISLVCKQWRLWVVRSLFSDIKIKDRSSAIGLRKTLERPATANGHYGEMVRWFLKSCIIHSYCCI